MPLEIQPSRSKWFYGRLVVNGKSVFQNLNVKIEGKPPRSMREEGDVAFERSRARAQVKLDELKTKLLGKSNTEEFYQKILEVRVGERMSSVLLSEIPKRWEALPRRRTPAKRYIQQGIAVLTRFLGLMNTRFPTTKEMAAVTDVMAREYMKMEEARGISPKSYNDILKLLRSCFKKFRKEAGSGSNPFDEIPTKESDTIHRIPFSAEELSLILNAAKNDPDIYPLVVIGVSTAMRLGDCAKIMWKTVSGDFIDVRAGKTGKWVTIPLFETLRSLLRSQTGPKQGLIFPKLAKQYEINSGLLLKKVRRIMESVGFGDPKKNPDGTINPSKGAFQQHREKGIRRASLRDFHSFRVTWVTLALNTGLSVDLVRKVTGHQTVEIVLTNYHQPGREDFRRELISKLPSVLTGNAEAPLTTLNIRSRLLSMTADSWEKVRDELVSQLPNKN